MKKRPTDRPRPNSRSRLSKFPKINSDADDKETTGTSKTDTRTFGAPLMPEGAATLTILVGPDEGRVYALNYGETWIGRDEDCDVVLNEKGVSRRHACIVVTNAATSIRDNKAKNGTFVNERRVTESELRLGDEIQVGPHACLLFSRARVVAEKLAKSEQQRLESLAAMVAGVAHEINTPLGVANTANAIIESLAEEARRNPHGERFDELLADLKASAMLVTKSLERTSKLVRTFKQLSSLEREDDRTECDLAQLLRECVETARAEYGKDKLLIRTEWEDAGKFPWVGFPASMYNVINHLLQNTIRYGYPSDDRGTVDVRLANSHDKYRLEVEDYGVGVEPALLVRMFEPFVTSGRANGAAGLGLAVVRNIVTNVFGGTIRCTSREQKGTKFTIIVPHEAPKDGIGSG